MLTWKQNRDELKQALCKILKKYLIGGDKRTSYAQDTTKQNYQTEKMKKKNSAQCNRYKQSKKKEWTEH